MPAKFLHEGQPNHLGANFVFPVRSLENDLVRLIPFQSSIHAEAFFIASSPHPEMYRHLPFGPFATCEELLEEFIEGRIGKDPGMTLFAIYDKTRPRQATKQVYGDADAGDESSLAGIIGLLNTSPVNLCTEIGFIMVLPLFQRTHITSNAIGLLLHYALDLPAMGGIGLRRVVWQADSTNEASLRAAERMGFTKEGILRWDRVLPKDKGKIGHGRENRGGDPREDCLGRDTVILGLCWEEWEDGVRTQVQAVMQRQK